MPKWVADQKKKEKEAKAATKTKSQSSSVTKQKTTTPKATKAASKSTFLGGGETVKRTEQKQATVKKQPSAKAQAVAQRAKATNTQRQANRDANLNLKQTVAQTSRTRTAQAEPQRKAAQQQKMTAGVDAAKARTQTRAIGNAVKSSVKDSLSADNRAFAQRQKSGTLTEADKQKAEQRDQRRAQIAKNTGAVAKKAVKDTLTGYGKTMADLSEMTQSTDRATYGQAAKLGIDKDKDTAQWNKLESNRKKGFEQARQTRLDLQKKQDERQAEWDERTKNAKGLEKAWYGAVESGTGMLADTAVGAVTGTGQFGALASMGLRTYGTTRGQAEKEGATAREDRLYSLAQAGKEVGTELMFQGAGLAKAAYGKTGLSLADKSANILTRGLTGVKADVVGAGVRALGGTAEENVEELAGWIADPLIKELTYGRNVRNRMKENLRANIPQIGSGADAAHVASYFSTPKFTDDLTKEYVKSGLSKDKASELAAEMRDYYVAYYSGDKEKLDALETDLAAKLSGQDKLSFKSWSMDELKDTFASTTLLTLATGIPGAVNSSVKGNRIFDSDEVKAVFGDDAVKKVADAVKNTSNKEMSLKAETMKQRLDTGKDLTGTQKFDLYQGYLEKVNETAKKARASQGVIENAREEQNLVPTMGVDRAGNTVYAKETQREYNEKFESTATTAEALRKFMESDNSISDDEIRRTDAAIKAVSDLHVGGLTIGDAHEFAYGNNLARETLKAEEGIDLDRYIVRDANGNVDLAATNEATENALFEINAANAIKAAQAETEVYIDDTRGTIDKDLLTRFGNNGQAVWKEVNKDLDPRDLKNYLTTANAASYFYSAGRNTDMSVNEAIDRYADTFKTVDNSVLEKAFAAGAEDRIIANTPGYGQTVEAGSNIPLKKTKPIITGQLIMDKDVVIPDSDQSAYLALAMSTNSNIHIVGSLKSSTGAEINGMSHGNDIYLNVNSAAEANLGYVFMHEMTHQIKQYAPNEYLALENLVRDKWFNKDAVGMQSAIKQRIDLYSTKGGQKLTEEEAVEEIIADAMAEAMDDPAFAAEVCAKDINLGQEILNSIRAALRSIRQMFANVENTNDRFHNSLLSYLGILDEAEKMWINALATARQNKADGLIADWQDKANKQNAPRLSVTEEQTESMETTISDADRKTLNNEGIEELDDGTTARYSVTSWGETNKDKKLKALVAAGHNKEAASKWIDDVNSIASIILDDPERLDYEADRTNKFLKPNGDYYKYTLDASTLCDKRRIYQGTYNAIQHIIPNAPLLQEDVVRIRTLLKDYDHKAPCGICYVESQRKNLGQYAKEWYDNYARKDEIKLADVTTSDGLKELKKTNPEVASDFEKAMAAKGVSSPKVVKLRTDYREDIMRMRPDTVKYLNDIGGLRFHSFSDFETPHLIDTMQAVMDMSAKGLKGMAYAKVPNFAAVFGPTGIKINLSLIAKTDENGNAVHDENGRLVFDSVEGIPYKEASKWRDAYPDNVAFILVGKDKEHTLEAINDDRVDFVIPFHRSKWSAEDMRRLGLIGYEDFATGHQENGIFVSQYWNYEKTGKENAEAYLELCAKEGVAPVFEQLLKDNGDGTYSLQEDGSTDNYWKLLVEGKMYNHKTKEGAPQKVVLPNFNMDEARRVLNEYEGGANTLPVADDVVKAFIKEYKQNHPDVEIADAKMSISVDMDDAYMDAVNSGNMDEAQRLVDEAAKKAMPNTKLHGPWYHGTDNDFNIFDFRQGGAHGTAEGFGIYLSNSQEVTSYYGNRQIKGYVNMQRPASAFEQTLTQAELKNLITATIEYEAQKMIDEYDDDIEAAKKDTWISNYVNTSQISLSNAISETAKVVTQWNGNDMDIVQEIMNGMGIRSYDEAVVFNDILTETTGIDGYMTKWGDEDDMSNPDNPTIAVAFRSNQIKSADPVTYAEDGSVIPLSERFDPTNNDIRYSLPTQDSDGEILTDGQMEYFKNSQARDIFGRLVPVYHATDEGGFTIFDPMRSDDHRSLFFSNRRDVAKTYAYNGGNAFDFEPKQINDWNDLIRYGRQLFSDADMSWDNDTDDNNLDFELYGKETGNFADKGYDEWLSLVESNDPHANDYRVKISLPYNNKDGETETISFEGDSVEDLLNKVSNGNIPHGGHYQVYLNLENPLIIEGHGQPWNNIVDGGSVFPAYSSITLRSRSWFEEEAESRDEMYELGQSLYNGDKARERVQEFESGDYVEIEIFNGEKKIKAIIPLTEEAVAEEAAAAFGVDDIELLQGVASEIVGDMEVGNITKIYDTDMRNTIGEYGYDTREWAEFAEDEGYDGVIFRNIIDLDNKTDIDDDEGVSDIYVAFSSNQVKDTRNENPTENPDIRYSITPEDEAMSHMAHDYAYDTSYEALAYYEQYIEQMSEEDLNDGFIGHPMQKLMDRLSKYGETDEAARRGRNKYKYRQTYKIDNEEEFMDEFYTGLTRYADGMKFDDPVLEEGRVRMAKSRQDFFNSNVAKWDQTWVTDGEVLKIESIRKPVRDLVMSIMSESNTNKKYKSDLVKTTLMNMRFAYMYAQRGRTDLADALLWHTALRMIDGVDFYTDDGNYTMYKELRDYFKDTRISLGEEYWNDVDFGAFRKENFGRINLVKGETNVYNIYSELEEMYPGIFDSETYNNVPDQLVHMASVLDSVQPYAEAYSSEYCAEWATDIASSLLDIMENQGEALVSNSDRYEAKIKAMKARHAEAMLKVRQQRDEGIKREKAKFKEYKEQQKEKRAHSKYFDSIQKTHKKLTERLLTNTADKNIPEQYKRDLAKLLAAFDLQTVGSKKYEARTGRQGQKTIKMAALKTALNNIENKSHEFHVSDAITDIIDELLGKDAGAGYNRSIEGLTIDELSASELERIDKMLKALLHEFNTYRNVRVGAKRQQVEDIGKAQVDSALEHAKIFGAGRDYQNIPGGIDRIINLDEVTPTYMFRHIDPEKSGLGLMFRELRRSFDKYVRNQEQLNGWMNEIVGKYHKKSKLPWKKYGAGELENWRSENYAQTFNLENGPVTLTPAQMMSLYCLSKRTQAYNHMTGAGIVVAPVSFNAKIMSDLKKKPNKALPVKLTDADIKQIVSQLTPDQIKVADDLQKLMADKMAAWGNEASMDVLGIELFGEPDYFPIKSDKAALETDLNANEFVEAIRNFGFAKAVQPGARNAIMVDDIFNVVTEHCNNMNLYNAYSAAMNDFMKVYNYRDFRDDGSEYTVKQAVAHAYGSKATTFIMTFMRDLNGNVSGRASGIENLYNSLLGNAKKAAVFANLRVAAQQPTAITRAFAAIHPKYLKGIAINEKAAEGIMNEMFEHCPIALWKSWGYYDINMGKSIEDIMMNNGRWLEDAATELYGYLDNVTWSAIWQMVKAEMKDTHPDVKAGTDEYWELCNERMTEVVDLTQVVDSPFHRSHAMRDKGIFVKAATSFMAEPTLTFNMLRDGVIRSREAWRKGDKAEATKIAATIGAVALLQAGTIAGAAGLIDALRKKRPDKDDEDEGFLHLWWVNAANNFHDELKVWNKIYFVKDIASIFDGWENSNLALQGIQKFALGYRQLTGDPYARSSAAWYENVADGIGYMTGVPVKTVRTGLKNAMGLFGVSVSALDSIGEKLDSIPDKKKEDTKIDESSMAGKLFSMILSDNDEDTLLDKYAKKKGYRKKDEPEKSEGEKGTLTESELRESIKASLDAFDEKYNKLSEKAAENAEGKTGNARNEALWDVLSEGYTKSLAAGNMAVIQRMRDEFEKNGGDVSWFDAKITDAAKSEYKKTLYSTDESAPGASTRQRLLHDYMTSHGVTDEEISDICYHSALAKDLKAAMRIGKEEYIMDELVPLVEAGLTREDYERLYKYRNYGANKYNGKYSDPEYTGTTGTFIWPASGTITSHFGYRNAPTAGASSNHPAIDIAVPVGTPVAAADGGTVIYCGRNSGYGISVGIKHANGMVTYYNHLSGYNVNVGDQVAQGQQIAQSGNTGISTGPHLDFKILDADGNPVDPEKYLGK